MLIVYLSILFVSIAMFFIVVFPVADNRPKLVLGLQEDPIGLEGKGVKRKWAVLAQIAIFNKPLISKSIRARVRKDASLAHLEITVEEFWLYKELCWVVLLFLAFLLPLNMRTFAVLMAIAIGYVLPEMWLRKQKRLVKDSIIRDLPDVVDLLGLCVNAGLDFMMALKWVIGKSEKSFLMTELNNVLNEINVGKTRRDALRDLARKYDLPDLSTFSRTLIQADKMGTSVSEALSMLSEDMRLARFRRGESIALKAPMKMLVPLLFFILPSIAILVGGPIFIEFMHNNPLEGLSGR